MIIQLIIFALAMWKVWELLVALRERAVQWYTVGPIRPYTYVLGQLSVQTRQTEYSRNHMKVFLEGEASERFDAETKMAICHAIERVLQNKNLRNPSDVEIH